MATLLVVGAGLFGSQAAAYARQRGIEAVVFDPGLTGAASPAAAGLFYDGWVRPKFREHYARALPVLDQLFGLRRVALTHDDGRRQECWFVPPSAILEARPVHARVTAVGDGWLEAEGRRHCGWVYIAAGVWCEAFLPGLGVVGKAGSSFAFAGERPGRIRAVTPARQGIAFVRDPGQTYFSDGTAEVDFTPAHDERTRAHAAALGLTDAPVARYWGRRPYVPGGPLFRRLGSRTWLATGGQKVGTIFGASFARRLVEDELRSITA